MNDVTQLLSAIERGDPRAVEGLLPLVYDELRRLAAHRLAREQPGQTLQATALVHEAYLRLVDADQTGGWNSRGHFFAAAAEAMRRILVDQARRKRAERHGGGRDRVALDENILSVPTSAPTDDLLALDEALAQLERQDPLSAQLVKLSHFAGLNVDQAAAALGMSRATAYRQLAFARAWLRCRLSGDPADPSSETTRE